MMKALTSIAKDSITRDWQEIFPSMGIYKRLHILKRVGPVLVGVCLDRRSGNSSYVPTSHVHCLLRPFPVVRLTLAQPLVKKSGVVWEIPVALHEAVFSGAAHDLKRQSYVSLDEAVSFSGLMDAYTRYLTSNNLAARFPLRLYEDMALLYAWHGDGDKARELIQEACKAMRSWPAGIANREGGCEGWKRKICDLLSPATSFVDVLLQQVEVLELSDIPFFEIS